jgi:protein-S-isoprenylcysteine O-methyltransferase Ste14
VKSITQISRHLFRYRAAIGVAFFVLLIFFARPISSLAAHILILTGMALRFWAAGYIGPGARKHEFYAEYRINNGPYCLLKHPLYIGNFLLVSGVLVLYNPPRWLGILYMILFVIMYTLIALGERGYVGEKKEHKAPFRLGNLRGEISTLLVLVVVYVLYWVSLLRAQ